MSEIASRVFGLRISTAVVAFLGLGMIWACLDHYPEILTSFVTPDTKAWTLQFGPHPAFILTLETICFAVAIGLVSVPAASRAAG
jgi:hypothetical protein